LGNGGLSIPDKLGVGIIALSELDGLGQQGKRVDVLPLGKSVGGEQGTEAKG
jgi:hypothetical protein